MPQQFSILIQKNEGSIVRAWVDEMYAERRTELTAMLTYEQLVDHLPDIIEELSQLLDHAATDAAGAPTALAPA